MSIGNITTIYSNSDDSWKDLGYYATAAIIAEDDNMTFTVGDESYTNYNFINYFNAALKEDTQYRVFIRLYSAANNPVCTIIIVFSYCRLGNFRYKLKLFRF